MKASLRNIQDVHDWFYEMKKPFWSMWTGHTKEIKERCCFNDDESDLDASWELITNQLRRKKRPGGRLTIFVTDKFGSPNGATEYIEFEEETSKSIAGINNGDTNTIAGKQLEVYIAEAVDTKLNDYKKDQRILELEAALEEKNNGSPWAKVINRLADEIPFDKIPVDEIIMSVIGLFTGQKQKVAISGINATSNEQPSETEGTELTEEQAAIINKALGSIMLTFPDIPDFLTRLAVWIEKNPTMAKSLLSQI